MTVRCVGRANVSGKRQSEAIFVSQGPDPHLQRYQALGAQTIDQRIKTVTHLATRATTVGAESMSAFADVQSIFFIDKELDNHDAVGDKTSFERPTSPLMTSWSQCSPFVLAPSMHPCHIWDPSFNSSAHGTNASLSTKKVKDV